MKIEQLQQLLQIVKDGSMNEAAQNLYIARSSLSSSMKSLEAELGAPIFERTSRGVALTAFGRDVYHQAQNICQRMEFLQQLQTGSSPARLSVSSMYCTLASDSFVELYRRRYEEGFICRLDEASFSDVIHQVSTGLTEIGVVTLFSDVEAISLRKFEETGLEFHLILVRPLHAIIGPQNPLYYTERSSVTLAELRDFPCVINYAAPGDLSGERIWEGGRRSTEVLVSDLGSALQIISRTNAIAIDTYDEETYRTFYASERCRFLPLQDAPLSCKLGWIKRRDCTLSPTCNEFLQILQEKAEKTVR